MFVRVGDDRNKKKSTKSHKILTLTLTLSLSSRYSTVSSRIRQGRRFGFWCGQIVRFSLKHCAREERTNDIKSLNFLPGYLTVRIGKPAVKQSRKSTGFPIAWFRTGKRKTRLYTYSLERVHYLKRTGAPVCTCVIDFFVPHTTRDEANCNLWPSKREVRTNTCTRPTAVYSWRWCLRELSPPPSAAAQVFEEKNKCCLNRKILIVRRR